MYVNRLVRNVEKLPDVAFTVAKGNAYWSRVDNFVTSHEVPVRKNE